MSKVLGTPQAAREHVIDDLAAYISRHYRTDASAALVVLGDKGSPPRCAWEVPPPEPTPGS